MLFRQNIWIIRPAGWRSIRRKKWERLAGNVRHPFNEYLRIAAEYGVAGLLLVAGVIWLLWRWYRRCRPEDRPLYRSIGGGGDLRFVFLSAELSGGMRTLVLLLGVIVRGRPVCFYGGRWFKTGIGDFSRSGVGGYFILEPGGT